MKYNVFTTISLSGANATGYLAASGVESKEDAVALRNSVQEAFPRLNSLTLFVPPKAVQHPDAVGFMDEITVGTGVIQNAMFSFTIVEVAE